MTWLSRWFALPRADEDGSVIKGALNMLAIYVLIGLVAWLIAGVLS